MNIQKVIKAYECCLRPYNRKCEECPYEKDCCHDGMPTFGIKDALTLLKEQEVKTGNWVIVEYDTLTCSCCGESYYTGCDSTKEATVNLEKGNVYRYCPYCGSKMEGR